MFNIFQILALVFRNFFSNVRRSDLQISLHFAECLWCFFLNHLISLKNPDYFFSKHFTAKTLPNSTLPHNFHQFKHELTFSNQFRLKSQTTIKDILASQDLKTFFIFFNILGLDVRRSDLLQSAYILQHVFDAFF